MKTHLKKVVLAYSGGLDTSVIIPWLKEIYNCQIVAFIADLGQGDNFTDLKRKALQSGADKAVVGDLKNEFITNYLFPLLQSGAVYENKYLLGTAIARPLIAQRQVAIAQREHADAVAHGATGKGNDQVRFELTYMLLAPKLKIVAPWKDDNWAIQSRKDALNYAKRHNIKVEYTRKNPYSIDKNIWHTSFEGGVLEDPWKEPAKDMFDRVVPLEKTPAKAVYVSIDFEKGIPVGINGKRVKPLLLLTRLNKLAGQQGVGRLDMVENRLVGMKSRGVYETPGGTLLTIAHRELEEITLDRDTMHYKSYVALRYAELVYNGQWFSTLRMALDQFIGYTQQNVSGTVKLRLYKGNCMVAGKKAGKSLYSEKLATFEGDDGYNQQDAKGFIKLFSLSMRK